MCELLGVSAVRETEISGLLREFFSHSDKNPNGWGLALWDRRGASMEKEPVRASKSAYLTDRLRAGAAASTVLAHIRYATVGGEEYHNCHPFSLADSYGRVWTLIHNGTIFDYQPLSPFQYRQEGSTDSERILMYLVHMIDCRQAMLGAPMSARERLGLVQAVLSDMARRNKLNLLLYDGELMYAHTNYADSLYVSEENGAAVLSTKPLSAGTWKPVPFTALCAYRDGRLVFEGAPHGHEYIDDQEDMKYLYASFAGL